MKGDKSRNTFAAEKHYRQVLMQQGRSQTDADWNEQSDINDYLLRTETRDIIGPCCVPNEGGGFLIEATPDGTDLAISSGRIYVDGVLCELENGSLPVTFPDPQSESERVQLPVLTINGRDLEAEEWVEIFDANDQTIAVRFRIVKVEGQVLHLHVPIPQDIRKAKSPQLRRVTTYNKQSNYIEAIKNDRAGKLGYYLAYLDVWHRHITALEDPQIREVALGGPDTTTRSKTICQVKLFLLGDQGDAPSCSDPFDDWQKHIAPSTGQLAARARPTEDEEDPCILPPQAGYRRLENQLYRVEIHRGSNDPKGPPTFKWSRENGSLTFRIEEFHADNKVRVAHLGMDDMLGLHQDNWIEISDDNSELAGRPGSLLKIKSIDPAARELTLSGPVSGFQISAHAKVRRWDMTDGEILVSVPATNDGFILLEDGVEIRFDLGRFRTGDYWCIPARTATADVEWPRDFEKNPIPKLPKGIQHHYCKLAIVDNFEGWVVHHDCRHFFSTLCELVGEEPPEEDTGFHITDVLLRDKEDVSTIPLDNDLFVTPEQLAHGIDIVCDEVADFESVVGNQKWNSDPEFDSVVGKPVCTVQLDLPYPLNPNRELFPEPDDLIGFRPLTLFARLKTDGNSIIWQPLGASKEWLANRLSQGATSTIDRLFEFMKGRFGKFFTEPRILTRLTVKGSFIWAERRDAEGQLRYLDGTSFGIPSQTKTHTDVQLHSGDNKSGGDFEMWFWLVPKLPPEIQPHVRIRSLAFSPRSVVGGEQVTGTVSLTFPAENNGATVSLTSSNPALLPVPPTVVVERGKLTQKFTVQTNRLTRPMPASVSVTVTAAFGGRAIQGKLRITRR